MRTAVISKDQHEWSRRKGGFSFAGGNRKDIAKEIF